MAKKKKSAAKAKAPATKKKTAAAPKAKAVVKTKSAAKGKAAAKTVTKTKSVTKAKPKKAKAAPAEVMKQFVEYPKDTPFTVSEFFQTTLQAVYDDVVVLFNDDTYTDGYYESCVDKNVIGVILSDKVGRGRFEFKNGVLVGGMQISEISSEVFDSHLNEVAGSWRWGAAAE